ncbi:RrF2 family transcriptional regulator [uncultured Parolsenella sp.]|uniref:RrF2 family transcriptional regulator n=1 Tax=uncultured Parolsenella sp. TaxID=2083008 RepID=UPI0025EF2EAF|nr:RrF2 family transcriptional regulator [uncultured Parolsenella sp.]
MASGISTKGRYALRVMADLAAAQGEAGWVSLGDISRRQGISRKYLEQVMASLHKAKFVVSQRGKGGGYRLARKPEDYTLGELIRVAEGSSLAPVSCLDCSNGTICPRTKICPTLPVWQELGALVSGFLDSKHLSDIVDDTDGALDALDVLGAGLCK